MSDGINAACKGCIDCLFQHKNQQLVPVSAVRSRASLPLRARASAVCPSMKTRFPPLPGMRRCVRPVLINRGKEPGEGISSRGGRRGLRLIGQATGGLQGPATRGPRPPRRLDEPREPVRLGLTMPASRPAFHSTKGAQAYTFVWLITGRCARRRHSRGKWAVGWRVCRSQSSKRDEARRACLSGTSDRSPSVAPK